MRLFVAIELDEPVKEALIAVQNRLGRFSREVRWARPEQMHLTLKFLGEVPDEQVEAVCTAAGQVATQVGPFEIALAQCGCFPPRGAVRIVHCGTIDPTHSLQRCSELFEQAFAELGFARERRPFRAHLTVGRVREDRTQGRLRAAVDKIECEPLTQSVDALFVVQSQLDRGGARYANVARHELAAGA